MRVSQGMSQVALAKLIGMKSSQSIANIEGGTTTFPARHGRRFCQVTGVTRSALIAKMVGEYEKRLRKKIQEPRSDRD